MQIGTKFVPQLQIDHRKYSRDEYLLGQSLIASGMSNFNEDRGQHRIGAVIAHDVRECAYSVDDDVPIRSFFVC